MTEIIKGLFVGDMNSVYTGFQNVVNCATELTNFSNRPKGHYLRIDLNDSGDKIDTETFEESIEHFVASRADQMVVFVETALGRGETVLIHCYMGISRSCSVAAAFLLSQDITLTVDEAIDFIISKKPNAFDGGNSLIYYPSLQLLYPGDQIET